MVSRRYSLLILTERNVDNLIPRALFACKVEKVKHMRLGGHVGEDQKQYEFLA